MHVDHPIISADSHITEAPDTYSAYIDPKFRDVAPRVVETEDRGDVYVIDGMKSTVPMGLVAAAGLPWDQLNTKAKYADLHRSGYDSSARIADQNRDGVSAEIIYPSVGMILCNHPDFEYKTAAMAAYNRWIAQYCSIDTNRLLALGQTSMSSPEQGIADLEEMKAMGMRGVMMPGEPKVEDYDSPIYDEFWQACVDLGLVPSFHILTGRSDNLSSKPRGPKMNSFLSIIRGVQDVMGMLVLGGVFERVPALKVVCVEADAGWVPHYTYRMDHIYNRHRFWNKAPALERLPSEYFFENVFLTFQDDWTALKMLDQLNPQRLLWANDFPHSDSTWPLSESLVAEHFAGVDPQVARRILRDNATELFGITAPEQPPTTH